MQLRSLYIFRRRVDSSSSPSPAFQSLHHLQTLTLLFFLSELQALTLLRALSYCFLYRIRLVSEMYMEVKCCACSEGDKVVTVRVGDMLRHNNEYHPYHSFKCDLCLSAFTMKAAKEEHERTDRIKIQCVQCHRRRGEHTFLARDEFDAHYRVEHRFFTVECEKCPNRFQTPRTCNEHMRVAHDHPRPDPLIRCLNCKKKKKYSNIKKTYKVTMQRFMAGVSLLSVLFVQTVSRPRN